MQEIPAIRLVEGWQRRYGINIQSELADVSMIRLLECLDCSLRYFTPPGLAGSAALYAALEKYKWYYMPRKWEHDIALQDIDDRQKVLEVGCGVGDFVTRLRENGLNAEGIELNENAVQTAQARGTPVRRIDLADLTLECAGCYEALCTFQVLEHVPTPRQFLQDMCTLLGKGGVLIIGVPNAESYIHYQFNLLDMPPHHLTRWTPLALENLARYFPLRLVRLEKESLADYHVPEYVDACLSRLFGPFNRQPLRIFFAWLIRRIGLRKRLTGHTIYAAYERT